MRYTAPLHEKPRFVHQHRWNFRLSCPVSAWCTLPVEASHSIARHQRFQRLRSTNPRSRLEKWSLRPCHRPTRQRKNANELEVWNLILSGRSVHTCNLRSVARPNLGSFFGHLPANVLVVSVNDTVVAAVIIECVTMRSRQVWGDSARGPIVLQCDDNKRKLIGVCRSCGSDQRELATRCRRSAIITCILLSGEATEHPVTIS